MSAAQLLGRMLREMQADRAGYALLGDLLEAQFQAALRQSVQRLQELAEEITVLAGELQARSVARGRMLTQLLGPAEARPTLERLQQRLPAQAGQTVAQAWQDLEQQIQQCKAKNLRNCRLITEQHALMQRVLGTEEPLYAER